MLVPGTYFPLITVLPLPQYHRGYIYIIMQQYKQYTNCTPWPNVVGAVQLPCHRSIEPMCVVQSVSCTTSTSTKRCWGWSTPAVGLQRLTTKNDQLWSRLLLTSHDCTLILSIYFILCHINSFHLVVYICHRLGWCHDHRLFSHHHKTVTPPRGPHLVTRDCQISLATKCHIPVLRRVNVSSTWVILE